MTQKAIDLYNELSEIEQAIGDALDDIPADAVSDRELTDLKKARQSLTDARTALERAAARFSTWTRD